MMDQAQPTQSAHRHPSYPATVSLSSQSRNVPRQLSTFQAYTPCLHPGATVLHQSSDASFPDSGAIRSGQHNDGELSPRTMAFPRPSLPSSSTHAKLDAGKRYTYFDLPNTAQSYWFARHSTPPIIGTHQEAKMAPPCVIAGLRLALTPKSSNDLTLTSESYRMETKAKSSASYVPASNHDGRWIRHSQGQTSDQVDTRSSLLKGLQEINIGQTIRSSVSSSHAHAHAQSHGPSSFPHSAIPPLPHPDQISVAHSTVAACPVSPGSNTTVLPFAPRRAHSTEYLLGNVTYGPHTVAQLGAPDIHLKLASDSTCGNSPGRSSTGVKAALDSVSPESPPINHWLVDSPHFYSSWPHSGHRDVTPPHLSARKPGSPLTAQYTLLPGHPSLPTYLTLPLQATGAIAIPSSNGISLAISPTQPKETSSSPPSSSTTSTPSSGFDVITSSDSSSAGHDTVGGMMSVEMQSKQRKESLYKTELCRGYEEKGNCDYGAKCQFAHGKHELRIIQRHPKWKTELCRTFWRYGTCPYAKRCCFIHEAKEAIGPSAHSKADVPTPKAPLFVRVRNSHSNGIVTQPGATTEDLDSDMLSRDFGCVAIGTTGGLALDLEAAKAKELRTRAAFEYDPFLDSSGGTTPRKNQHEEALTLNQPELAEFNHTNLKSCSWSPVAASTEIQCNTLVESSPRTAPPTLALQDSSP